MGNGDKSLKSILQKPGIPLLIHLVAMLGGGTSAALIITGLEYNFKKEKGGDEYFEKIDINHDGTISRDEWQKYYDSNLRGYLH